MIEIKDIRAGMPCTIYGHTDKYPAVVTTVSFGSKTKIKIIEVEAVPDPSWRQQHVSGGFFGNVANQDSQKWIIDPNKTICPEFLVKTKELKNGVKKFVCNRGEVKFGTAERFHDYNF